MQSTTNTSLVYTTNATLINSFPTVSEKIPTVIFDDKLIVDHLIRSVVQRLSSVLTQRLLHPKNSINISDNVCVNTSLFSSYSNNPHSSESTTDLLRNSSFELSNSPEEINLLRRVESTVMAILIRLRERVHIRETELFHAIALIDRVVCKPQEQFVFSERELSMTILISLLLAHKMSADITYPNSFWCSVFGIPLASLNESEVVFLDALGFDLSVSLSELENIRHFLLSSQKPFQ